MMRGSNFVFQMIVTAALPMVLCAQAVIASPDSPANKPNVEWTRVQDLRPDQPSPNAPIHDKFAIVVGISDYSDSRLNDGTHTMERAAKEFYDYLVDPRAGRFAPDHVRMLVNGSATHRALKATMGEQWLGKMAQKDDLVVVFISTGSFPTTDGSVYLCAYDCALDNIAGTCLSVRDLMGSVRKNTRSDRILLVLQSCYGGSAELANGAKSLANASTVDLSKLEVGAGGIILTSSGTDERTWGDTFSHNLVESLKQKDGMVALSDAFAAARDATIHDTTLKNPAMRQTPTMKSAWKGHDLVLGMPAAAHDSSVPQNVTSYLSAESHYLSATRAMAAGKLDDAISEYKSALTEDPQYADAVADLSGAYYFKGDLPAAAEGYRKAIGITPDDSLFHLNYARVLDKQGVKDESQRELVAAHALNPRDSSILAALARNELAAGHVGKAIDFLSEACANSPNSADLEARLSLALSQDNRPSEALDHALRAAQIDPRALMPQIALGSAHLSLGDGTQAVSASKQAVESAPGNLDAHLLLARSYLCAGDNARAKAEFEQFLKICPSCDARLGTVRKQLENISSSSPPPAR